MNRSILPAAQPWVGANQRLIHEALAIGVLQRVDETVGVVPLAGVEPEYLLVNVGIKVERSRSDICPVERSFQARPKVFNLFVWTRPSQYVTKWSVKRCW